MIQKLRGSLNSSNISIGQLLKLKTMLRSILTHILLLIALATTIAQPDIIWKFKTNGRIYSSPIIQENIVFVGSGDNNFYAINKSNGKELWSFKTGGAIHSSAVITNNIICFASADGNLYGLDKAEGNMIWKFESKGEKMYDLWDYYHSSPREDGGYIYWGCGDGNVYAVKVSSGELKWKFKTDDVVHASPVIYKDNVYIGSFDGNLYCIQKDTGSLVWKFKTIGATYFPKGEIQRAALIAEDVVYFGSRDYNIYAVDANTGRGRWNLRQERGWIIATPIEYKGNIYFGTSDAHIFYSMDKLNGTINWTIPVSMRVYGTAIAYKDMIYFGTFDGKVLGVDYLIGKTKWEFQTENSQLNYSTIYNENGEFKESFELYSSNFKESEALIHSLGSILSSPIIDEQIIYFGSSDGYLYAVKLG